LSQRETGANRRPTATITSGQGALSESLRPTSTPIQGRAALVKGNIAMRVEPDLLDQAIPAQIQRQCPAERQHLGIVALALAQQQPDRGAGSGSAAALTTRR